MATAPINPTHSAASISTTSAAVLAANTSRRYALLVAYASTYYGEPSTWPATIRELVKTAEQLCKQQTRIDELQYV